MGLERVRVIRESPLPSYRELPLPIDGDGFGLHEANAPNGGYLASSAPSGGLPHTTTSGRG